MRFSVANMIDLRQSLKALAGMGFRTNVLDSEENRKRGGKGFVVRRNALVASVELSGIGTIGNQIGNIGLSVDDIPVVGQANTVLIDTQKAISTILGSTATGVDIGIKLIVGTAAILAGAILLPKIIDSFATSYDRINEVKTGIKKEKEQKTMKETVSPITSLSPTSLSPTSLLG